MTYKEIVLTQLEILGDIVKDIKKQGIYYEMLRHITNFAYVQVAEDGLGFERMRNLAQLEIRISIGEINCYCQKKDIWFDASDIGLSDTGYDEILKKVQDMDEVAFEKLPFSSCYSKETRGKYNFHYIPCNRRKSIKKGGFLL